MATPEEVPRAIEAPESRWTPAQIDHLKFAAKAIDNLARGLIGKEGRPRISANYTRDNWEEERRPFINRVRRSRVIVRGMAEVATDDTTKEGLTLAQSILGGLAYNTSKFGNPRVNLRKLGVSDPDRRDFGVKMLAASELIRSELPVNPIEEEAATAAQDPTLRVIDSESALGATDTLRWPIHKDLPNAYNSMHVWGDL
jgi:hypothetical protein